MDFDLTDAQQALRERARALCREHCTEAQTAELDRHPHYPEALHDALAETGLLGHCLPGELGGGGGGLLDMVVICEELGRYSNAAVNIMFVNMSSAMLVALTGSAEQRERIVPAVARGEARLALALTEPGAGSDAAAIRTRAERDHDGYVIHGEKLYTTGARDADHILTVLRTDPAARAQQGTSLVLVPTDADGLTIAPLEKIAGNAIASCRVVYDGVRVPADALVGEANRGWKTLVLGGGLERLLVGASSLGLAQAVLAEVVDFVGRREQFGQPVGRFQAIQHQIADMATEIEAMRWLVYNAAWRMDRGEGAAAEASMAKLYAAERLNDIANKGMRLLGGRAYFRDEPMQRHLRESLLGLYAGGTAEIQRGIIARGLGL